MTTPDFADTRIAFGAKTYAELAEAYFLFKALGSNTLVNVGTGLVDAAIRLHLPVKTLIKKTIFKQFCGGETIAACLPLVEKLARAGVKTVLDYSVESLTTDASFERAAAEVRANIELAAQNHHLPFAVFKMTAFGRLALLEKINRGAALSADEKAENERLWRRLHGVCTLAAERGVPLLVDAEETWIQDAIDALVEVMMAEFNRRRALVFNTVQMYRRGRLDYLRALLAKGESGGFVVGIKLVRGAYMEKERARAAALGYASPICPTKAASDQQFNAALKLLIGDSATASVYAGTHNEASVQLALELMAQQGIGKQEGRVIFSQLFGMSDHLTFNLAHHGYAVSKNAPYSAVRAVMPYLFRRAKENTSVQGQAGRELQLLSAEMQRRKKS